MYRIVGLLYDTNTFYKNKTIVLSVILKNIREVFKIKIWFALDVYLPINYFQKTLPTAKVMLVCIM